jgi:hypothetical protein
MRWTRRSLDWLDWGVAHEAAYQMPMTWNLRWCFIMACLVRLLPDDFAPSVLLGCPFTLHQNTILLIATNTDWACLGGLKHHAIHKTARHGRGGYCEMADALRWLTFYRPNLIHHRNHERQRHRKNCRPKAGRSCVKRGVMSVWARIQTERLCRCMVLEMSNLVPWPVLNGKPA